MVSTLEQKANKNYTNQTNTLIPSIDLFRVVCAVFVVIIHTYPVQNSVDYFIKEVLSRFAVPFFFCISGLFLTASVEKTIDKHKKIVRYLSRLISTYLIWSLLYYFVTILPQISHFSPHRLIVHTVRYAIATATVGGYFHLWYFPAVIFCTIVFYLFTKYNRTDIYRKMAIPLYILGLLGCSYYAVGKMVPYYNLLLSEDYYKTLFTPIRRILFMGLPFFILGNIIYEHRVKLICMKRMAVLFGLGASFVLFSIEIYLVNNYNISNNIIITAFLFPLVFFLVLVLMHTPLSRYQASSTIFRTYSNGIYYSHPMIMIALIIISNHISVLHTIYSGYMKTPFVLMGCLLFVYLLSLINNKHLNKLIH